MKRSQSDPRHEIDSSIQAWTSTAPVKSKKEIRTKSRSRSRSASPASRAAQRREDRVQQEKLQKREEGWSGWNGGIDSRTSQVSKLVEKRKSRRSGQVPDENWRGVPSRASTGHLPPLPSRSRSASPSMNRSSSAPSPFSVKYKTSSMKRSGEVVLEASETSLMPTVEEVSVNSSQDQKLNKSQSSNSLPNRSRSRSSRKLRDSPLMTPISRPQRNSRK